MSGNAKVTGGDKTYLERVIIPRRRHALNRNRSAAVGINGVASSDNASLTGRRKSGSKRKLPITQNDHISPSALISHQEEETHRQKVAFATKKFYRAALEREQQAAKMASMAVVTKKRHPRSTAVDAKPNAIATERSVPRRRRALEQPTSAPPTAQDEPLQTYKMQVEEDCLVGVEEEESISEPEGTPNVHSELLFCGDESSSSASPSSPVLKMSIATDENGQLMLTYAAKTTRNEWVVYCAEPIPSSSQLDEWSSQPQ